MTARRWVALALLLVAASGLLLWMNRAPRKLPVRVDRPEETEQPIASTAELSTTAETPAPPAPRSPPGARTPSSRATPPPALVGTPSVPGPPLAPLLAAGESANVEQQLDQVNLMLRDFRSMAGENPVGTNAEIMKTLMGDNPRQARLGPPPGQSLNGAGELLDPWGTPYFFHQLSGREMEIRSAGPDATMWTPDDQTKTSGTAGRR